jgi:hypothetical protein
MPDFTTCVRYNGKIYCWDKTTKKIALVEVFGLEFKECPDEVIRALLSAAEAKVSDTALIEVSDCAAE